MGNTTHRKSDLLELLRHATLMGSTNRFQTMVQRDEQTTVASQNRPIKWY